MYHCKDLENSGLLLQMLLAGYGTWQAAADALELSVVLSLTCSCLPCAHARAAPA